MLPHNELENIYKVQEKVYIAKMKIPLDILFAIIKPNYILLLYLDEIIEYFKSKLLHIQSIKLLLPYIPLCVVNVLNSPKPLRLGTIEKKM